MKKLCLLATLAIAGLFANSDTEKPTLRNETTTKETSFKAEKEPTIYPPAPDTAFGIYTSYSLPSVISLGIYYRGTHLLSHAGFSPASMLLNKNYQPFFFDVGFASFINSRNTMAFGLDFFCIAPKGGIRINGNRWPFLPVPTPSITLDNRSTFIKVRLLPLAVAGYALANKGNLSKTDTTIASIASIPAIFEYGHRF